MARIAGVDLPREKQIMFALPYIYGIGRPTAKLICTQASVEPDKIVSELDDDEIARLRSIIDNNDDFEGGLRRSVRSNIQRLIEINSYRGSRHRRGLPVRGQRTKTNARTRRGARRTISGKRQVTK